jgi:exodeoxyribonuclease-3
VSLRLLSYNIRLGGAGREGPLAAVIGACKPDLAILQEAVRPDVVERLAAACGMRKWGALRGHSLAFLSRGDIAHHAWHKIPLARRRYLEVVLEKEHARVFGVHLSAIHSNLTELRRGYEVRALLSGIARHQHGFHVVTGDFNTLAPREDLDLRRLPRRLRAIVWLTGRKIRWTTIQAMLDGGYIDGYRRLHEADAGFTFPTRDPHVRLDYTFLPAAFQARLRNCEVVRDAPGVREASDHFPLVSEISPAGEQ